MSAMTLSPEFDQLTDADRAEVERLMQTIDLESVVATQAFLRPKAHSTLEEITSLLERSPTSLLAGKISEIVAKLQEANPRVLAEKPSFVARLTGAGLERNVVYQVSRKAVDVLLREADRLADKVLEVVSEIDRLLAADATEARDLHLRLLAGRRFLDLNPEAGQPAPGILNFDNPRERFARKLASVAALLTSNEMSATQLRLARAQAVDMVDRYHEVSTVLVPVWRQNTLALVSSLNNAPDVIAAAVKAQDSLITNLTKLKGNAR